MKILVTGADGQLGCELRQVLEREWPGQTVYTDASTLDITDRQAVESHMSREQYTHVINCAAYTDVARAEDDKMRCAAVNVDGITNLARLADDLGYRIIHISTDYEFDGTAHRPYRESDTPHPLSHYGVTKRKGVTSLLGLAPESIVLRTGWLYSPQGRNFVLTMLRLGRERGRVQVVCDQVGTPTYAADLAEAIAAILHSPQWVPGIFNFSNEGVCSWYDLAVAVFDAAGKPEWTVEPVLTDEMASVVQRPHFSVLDKSRIKATYGIRIDHWHKALMRCLDRIKE